MTTSTIATESDGGAAAGAGVAWDTSSLKLTPTRVLRSEWIKFRSLKSNVILLASTCAALIAFGMLAAAASSGEVKTPHGGPPMAGNGPTSLVLSGANFAVLLLGVLGVLLGSREYSSGLIRTTLSAVPARLPVLWSKVAVLIAVGLPALLISVSIAFGAGTTILTNAGVNSAQWGDPGTIRAVIGTALYLLGIGVIGIALGVLLRSIASGLAVLLGGVLIVPTLAGILLPDSWDSVLKYLPSNAGAAFTTTSAMDGSLSPAIGATVFAAWIVAALIGAAIALRSRDA